MANPLGNITGGVVGAAVGIAAANVAGPELEAEHQLAWKENAVRVLDLGALAELVAQGLVDFDKAVDHAARSGYDRNKLAARVQLAMVAPAVESALELWRKGKITKALAEHALDKAGIEPQYHEPLLELYSARLDPAVIALAIVRGIIDDPGFLPVGPPSGRGKVPAFPTSPIDALDEAQAAGWDRARLFVQAAISGRPMGPESAAAAVFRQILERVDYDRAVSEGDVRNEWADAIFETARQIPSVADYVNARIRGWITEGEMNAGVARHGMSAEDAHLLYLRTGRPAAPGQMATAAARGIEGPDGRAMDREQFLKGIAESDIRPEWGPMLWESRFLYPPLFQLSRLVQAGAIDADTAAEWAVKDRYPPEVVTALHHFWQVPSTSPEKAATATDLLTLYDGRKATAAETIAALEALGYPPDEAQRKLDVLDARRVRAARDTAITGTHAAFKKGAISESEALIALGDLGEPEWAADSILRAWTTERNLTAPDTGTPGEGRIG